jgi:hypothetical protein
VGREKKSDVNIVIFYAAILIMILSFMIAYSISTNLVWPLGTHSAYYLIPGLNDQVRTELISVPTEVFLVSSESNRGSYNNLRISEMLITANTIWQENANITFKNIRTTELIVPDNRTLISTDTNDEAQTFGADFLGESYKDSTIDIVILVSVRGDDFGGGITVPSDRLIVMTELQNKSWADWTLAHELGHTLNLRDVVQSDNLMQWNIVPGNVDYKKKYLPDNLTDQQVLIARDWAFRVYCQEICLNK